MANAWEEAKRLRAMREALVAPKSGPLGPTELRTAPKMIRPNPLLEGAEIQEQSPAMGMLGSVLSRAGLTPDDLREAAGLPLKTPPEGLAEKIKTMALSGIGPRYTKPAETLFRLLLSGGGEAIDRLSGRDPVEESLLRKEGMPTFTPGEAFEIGAPFALPAGGAGIMRGLESRVMARSPMAKDILRYDLSESLRSGTGAQTMGFAKKALQDIGITPTTAERMVEGTNLSNIMQVMGKVRGTAGGRPGLTITKKDALRFKNPQLKEESFNILKSMGVEGDDAKRVLRFITKEPSEPLYEYALLAKTKPILGAIDARNPFVTKAASEARKRSIISTGALWHPETVMSLEPASLRIYQRALQTQDNIQQEIARFEKNWKNLTQGLTKSERYRLDKVGQAMTKGETISKRDQAFFNKVQEQIFDPIADMMNMGKKGSSIGYLQDYYPLWWTKDNRLVDAIETHARRIAREKDLGVWEELSDEVRGKLMIEADKMVKKIPDSFFFGNLSKSRTTEGSGQTHDIKQTLLRYIHGSMRKHYMDQFYAEAKPLIGQLETPGLAKYAIDYVDAFRGAPRGGFKRTFDTLRATAAWSKLGANMTSPILNLSQTSINTYSVVGAKNLQKALKMRFTREGQRLIEDSGVVLDTAKHELIGSELNKAMNNITSTLLFLFNKSEQFNREIALLGGYLQAKQRFPGASRTALLNEGRKVVNRTQFIFSPAGRPMFMQSPSGAMLGQFKLFGINQLRFIKSLRNEELLRFALSTALHGGMKGIPGTQNAMKIFWGLQAVQAVKDQDLPQFVEEAIIGGLPRAAGVSLEQDVGVGFVPTDLKGLVPPGVSYPVALATHLPDYLGERGAEGFAAGNKLITESVRNLPAGVQAERVRQAVLADKRGGAKLGPRGELQAMLSPTEVVKLGTLGGKTSEEAERRETQEFVGGLADEVAYGRAKMMHDMRVGLAERDPERVEAALQEALQSGVLEGMDVNELAFMPAALRQFMGLPTQAKVQALQSPAFQQKLLKELDAMAMFMQRAGETAKDVWGEAKALREQRKAEEADPWAAARKLREQRAGQ